VADRGSVAAGEMSSSKRQETARSTSPAMAMSDKRGPAERLCLGLCAINPRFGSPHPHFDHPQSWIRCHRHCEKKLKLPRLLIAIQQQTVVVPAAGPTANNGSQPKTNRFSVITNRNQKSTSWTGHVLGQHGAAGDGQFPKHSTSTHPSIFSPGPAKCARRPDSNSKAAFGTGQNGTSLEGRCWHGTSQRWGHSRASALPAANWKLQRGMEHAKNHEIFALSVPWELKREDCSCLLLLLQWLESGWNDPGLRLQCTERWKEGPLAQVRRAEKWKPPLLSWRYLLGTSPFSISGCQARVSAQNFLSFRVKPGGGKSLACQVSRSALLPVRIRASEAALSLPRVPDAPLASSLSRLFRRPFSSFFLPATVFFSKPRSKSSLGVVGEEEVGIEVGIEVRSYGRGSRCRSQVFLSPSFSRRS
jgi:hypothetical protein